MEKKEMSINERGDLFIKKMIDNEDNKKRGNRNKRRLKYKKEKKRKKKQRYTPKREEIGWNNLKR